MGHVTNATRGEFGVFPCCAVINPPGEFHDPVVYFHTDTARGDILFAAQFSQDFLLDLHIVFHSRDASPPRSPPISAVDDNPCRRSSYSMRFSRSLGPYLQSFRDVAYRASKRGIHP
jgi:hypothetical protein